MQGNDQMRNAIYDRESFKSLHVQAVVLVMLVKATDTSQLASANMSPLTNTPTSFKRVSMGGGGESL